MIYNLSKAIGVRVSPEIAECVYTALLTDTGSFPLLEHNRADVQNRL
jgi:nanoRNase/pAp phosphatase (c-di-AMP/oligoRNAs hydrolase)